VQGTFVLRSSSVEVRVADAGQLGLEGVEKRREECLEHPVHRAEEPGRWR